MFILKDGKRGLLHAVEVCWVDSATGKTLFTRRVAYMGALFLRRRVKRAQRILARVARLEAEVF